MDTELDGMVRQGDVDTSVDAAHRIRPHLGRLQREVYQAALELYEATADTPFTDGEVERLPKFADCAPTTVRKRLGELRRMGLLRWTGGRRDGMRLNEPVKPQR